MTINPLDKIHYLMYEAKVDASNDPRLDFDVDPIDPNVIPSKKRTTKKNRIEEIANMLVHQFLNCQSEGDYFRFYRNITKYIGTNILVEFEKALEAVNPGKRSAYKLGLEDYVLKNTQKSDKLEYSIDDSEYIQKNMQLLSKYVNDFINMEKENWVPYDELSHESPEFRRFFDMYIRKIGGTAAKAYLIAKNNVLRRQLAYTDVLGNVHGYNEEQQMSFFQAFRAATGAIAQLKHGQRKNPKDMTLEDVTNAFNAIKHRKIYIEKDFILKKEKGNPDNDYQGGYQAADLVMFNFANNRLLTSMEKIASHGTDGVLGQAFEILLGKEPEEIIGAESGKANDPDIGTPPNGVEIKTMRDSSSKLSLTSISASDFNTSLTKWLESFKTMGYTILSKNNSETKSISVNRSLTKMLNGPIDVSSYEIVNRETGEVVADNGMLTIEANITQMNGGKFLTFSVKDCLRNSVIAQQAISLGDIAQKLNTKLNTTFIANGRIGSDENGDFIFYDSAEIEKFKEVDEDSVERYLYDGIITIEVRSTLESALKDFNRRLKRNSNAVRGDYLDNEIIKLGDGRGFSIRVNKGRIQDIFDSIDHIY